jgi:hypothetical protein
LIDEYQIEKNVSKTEDEIDWNEICAKLKNHFNSSDEKAFAGRALAQLVRLGCDERGVLQDLFLYCGGNSFQIQAIRRQLDFPGKRKRLLRIARLLLEVSAELEFAESELLELGFEDIREFAPSAAKLRQYGRLLSRIGDRVYAPLASGKISGREQHLLHLCRGVRDQTKMRKPYYPQIAELVSATRRCYRRAAADETTADSIRQLVDSHS